MYLNLQITVYVGFIFAWFHELYFCFFSTPIFWRGMPTDCRLCCRGGNATRIEPYWVIKLWLWELSIWPRYGVSPSIISLSEVSFLLRNRPLCPELMIAYCFSLTVTVMAISVCVPCLGCQIEGLLSYTSYQMIHAHHTYCCVRLWAIWSWFHVNISANSRFSRAIQK